MSADFSGEIEILTGAEVVRRRPGMYFKVDDPDISTTLVLQALCHALDDAIDERCTRIDLRVAGTAIEVRYDSGMPLEQDTQYPELTIAGVFLTIHAGCHSRKRHFEVGSDFCQIGLAVLNAVCGTLTADIRQSGKQVRMNFLRGELQEMLPISATEAPDETRLRFELDASVISNNRPAEDAMRRALVDLRSRLPGLTIELEYLPHD